VPARGAVREEFFDRQAEMIRRFAERAAAILQEQLRIALLLSGNDLREQHRRPRGDRLLHGRAAGLADEQMVRHEQLRHARRPAVDFQRLAELGGELLELQPERIVAARGGGGGGRSGRSRAKMGATGKPSVRTFSGGTPASCKASALSSFGTMKVSLGQRCQTELIVIESVITV